MSKTNIWWPMYPADFAIDTAHLNTEEIGAYVLILNAAWRNGGYIFSDPKHLARLAGVSAFKWKKIGESLSTLFTEEDGKWRSPWLSEELTKAKANSEKKRQNANQRWGKPKDTAMQMHCPSPSPSLDTSHISSGTVPDEGRENDETLEIGILGGVA